MTQNIITTTTASIDQQIITDYIGVISADFAIREKVLKTIKDNLIEGAGLRKEKHKSSIDLTQDKCLQLLKLKAEAAGGTAVIGIEMNIIEHNSKLMMILTGTVVKSQRIDESLRENHGAESINQCGYLSKPNPIEDSFPDHDEIPEHLKGVNMHPKPKDMGSTSNEPAPLQDSAQDSASEEVSYEAIEQHKDEALIRQVSAATALISPKKVHAPTSSEDEPPV